MVHFFSKFYFRKSNSNLPSNYGTNTLIDVAPSVSTSTTTMDNRGAEVNTDNDKTNNNDSNLQQNRSAIYCLHGQHHIEGIFNIFSKLFRTLLNLLSYIPT